MLHKYEIGKHCDKCALSCKDGTVGGQSKVPFSEVKLIVVSSYPTNKDYKSGQSLADNLERKGTPNSNKAIVGAGEYLRFCLGAFLDRSKDIPEQFKPIEDYTYFTNALKCNPQHGKDKITVVEKHIKICKDTWLTNELAQFQPTVPIFACSSEAVKALLGTDQSLYNNRNRVNYYKQHPVIVSTNPIEWEKYVMYFVPDIEEARQNVVKLMKSGAIKKYKKNVDKVIGTSSWQALPGNPLYFVKQDLNLIKQEVVKYINYLCS